MIMQEPIERELKILVSQDIYEKIIHSYDFTKPWKQTNTYFDTPDHSIKNQKGAVRIRTIGDRHIFTLKIRKDAITHIELEKDIDRSNMQSITDPEILNWFKEYQINKEQLSPITTFSTVRQTYDFEHGQLCADKTIFSNHIDYELEYEYFDQHDGISFFNQILEPFHITYIKNCPSKIARAF